MGALHRLWSIFPRDARREALFGATALLAPRIARPEPSGEGPLIVAGYLSAPTGLGEGARRMIAAMREDGLEPIPTDLTGAHRQGPPVPVGAIPEGPGTIVVHVNGPMLPWGLLALGRRAVAGKRIIGHWAWELPVLPRDWDRGYAACHRVWTFSRFCAEVLARPGHPAPRVLPLPPPIPDPSALTRADFGLPDDAFVTLSVFDATSSLSRKNPLAAIQAHSLAFGEDPAHVLVLKTHGTAAAGAAWAPVAEAASRHPNVVVMDRHLPRRDLWALLRAADVAISLHRAEGYGLLVAEAMAMGRPVIATNWSGVTDFMGGPGAHPVGYRLVPARDPQGTYDLAGATWAEADVAEAAAALRRVAADPALRNPPPVALPRPDYRAALADRTPPA